MSREIQRDLLDLKDFLKSYSLSHLSNDTKLLSVITQQHKKYFSYLTFIAELEALQNSGLLPAISDVQKDYITESCSDIGNSMFVMAHGAYKASRMMLRSSIETFMKGFNADEIADILTDKSMYSIFDNIKALSFFQREDIEPIFISIHNDYKILCRDIHTATRANMDHLTALNYFPTFDEKAATPIAQISMNLVSNYLILLCVKYGTYFHKMHHRNRENILISIPKAYRPKVLGVK
ncbi:hypothetical protein EOD41_00115 [Mucilaginibacter limnophilus]|uniref:Uncharacterized protein n=1 Tax=Mucilaginibacter limnophilus TaxID=1932778 RepID=A0A437MXI4_9SPHI|nr:hypothetical protein [Mucilaginibacter limnophilus]RVU02381.1 hypothetical protein EOD41_00115 [Mucilaginibacter limnophilus]